MKKIFKKFKFKWFSWEIDAIKILNYFIIILAFLPILPYEKKDEKLISVMGFEARENNFYILGDFTIVDTFSDEKLKYEAQKTNKVEENNSSILEEIGEYLEKNGLVNKEKYKNYLDSKNYSEELKTCLILRNMLMSEIVVDSKIRKTFHDYVPSPVPAIWVLRIFIHYFLDYLTTFYLTSETLERGAKKCSEFEYLWPSEKYLDITFE
ncbi:hypothetical protein N9U76_01835 [Prochlorococcus sp. AH-736-L19]|nr:hypothetical protein [Prochlorococcus sp. AH-736-L19]MDA9704161.1 hypothetical protein [Prochlorococcus sp. AH-736-L19]